MKKYEFNEDDLETKHAISEAIWFMYYYNKLVGITQ